MRARFWGNCLAELDRFLHILMDEVAPAMGVLANRQQHNAANKIGDLVGGRWDPSAEGRRLNALGRSRACLSRCHGLVRRPDVVGVGWMTAGWCTPGSATLQRYDLGEQVTPAGAELAEVSLFYDALAARLAAEAT